MSSPAANKRRLSWESARPFVALFVAGCLLMGLILWLLYRQDLGYRREVIGTERRAEINLLHHTFFEKLHSLVLDLMLLASHQEIQDFWDHPDPETRRRLVFEFKIFVKIKKVYHQARLLAADGRELVRVDLRDGRVVVVPPEQLQDKSSRYYFIDTMRLEPGQIFISPFDLNVEHGRIELPHRPMLRAGTPILDRQGRKRGMVILNLLGRTLLETFEQVQRRRDERLLLLNRQGYLLYSPWKQDNWAFMFSERKERTFARRFPTAWPKIASQERGQFYDRDGLFTFATVNAPQVVRFLSRPLGSPVGTPAPARRLRSWKIVFWVPAEMLARQRQRVSYKYLLLYLLAVLLMAAAGWVGARAYREHLRAQSQMLKAIQAAREAHRVKSEFLTTMSHELHTPLNAIQGFTELLGDVSQECNDQTRREYLGYISQSSKRLLEMVNTILELSSLESGKVKAEKAPVELATVLGECLAVARHKAPGKEQHLELVGDPSLEGAMIMTDPDKLRRVLGILLENAVEFTPAGGHIELSYRRQGDELLICVKDDGAGIKADDLERIFDNFVQADSSLTRQHEGSGLGLTLARRLVELMGGRIWAESAGENQGSRFCFTLPLETAQLSPRPE